MRLPDYNYSMLVEGLKQDSLPTTVQVMIRIVSISRREGREGRVDVQESSVTP